jgi:hypothetical protein
MMAKKWTAEEILNTVRAFQPACVITAAAELDVFAALGPDPTDVESLAGKLGTDPRGTTVLLDALSAMGLLAKRENAYSVPADVAELLTEGGERNILPSVRHLGNCLRRWAQLAAVTKSGEPAERIASIRGEAADQAAFIGAMDNFSSPVAAEVVGRLGPVQFNNLLDVGGASGTWTIAFLQTATDARATVFDLPEVIAMAKRRIADAGLAERVTFAPGDFYEDDLPGGADLALLSAIAHQNSRRQNRDLFAKVCGALVPAGIVVIRDVVMDPDRTSPAGGAMFAINMLVATPGGGTYTFDEYRQDLCKAGFADVTMVHRDEFMNSLIRARKK